jgi:hypothetical protein
MVFYVFFVDFVYFLSYDYEWIMLTFGADIQVMIFYIRFFMINSKHNFDIIIESNWMQRWFIYRQISIFLLFTVNTIFSSQHLYDRFQQYNCLSVNWYETNHCSLVAFILQIKNKKKMKPHLYVSFKFHHLNSSMIYAPEKWFGSN